MKELELPHNDWWTSRERLNLGTLQLMPGPNPRDPVHLAGRLFQQAQDASHLSRQVKLGMQRLIDQRRYTNLPAALRSVFATMEMNLASDVEPFQSASQVALPAAFFVDPRLSGESPSIPVARAAYLAGLQAVGSRFAPDEAPGLAETRHAFLVPVRSHVDNLVIDSLIKQGVLDSELVADILAVDFTQPVYSVKRASLLPYVPASAADAADLKNQLIANLLNAPGDPAAQELLANLTEPGRNAAFHQARARQFLSTCARTRAVADWLKLASQRRQEVAASETSRNPRGQILEPGFRVIFPVNRLTSRPQALSLDANTCLCQ